MLLGIWVLRPALVANWLCRTQEKRVTREPEAQIGNSGLRYSFKRFQATVSAIFVIPCRAGQVQRFDKDAV